MTKEEILQLKAGREFDRLVAEKIFKRDPHTARHGLHKDGDIEYQWDYPGGHDIAPYYSSDRNAAFVMEQELEKLGLTRNYILALADIYDAIRFNLRSVDGRVNALWAFATVDPLFKCQAALIAIS
jgi:hypothetical protein